MQISLSLYLQWSSTVFSLGSFPRSPLPPFAFPHQSLVALSQAVSLWELPFAVLVLPPSPALSCWNCPCHGHGLCSARGRGAQRSSVCLQLQSQAQTHWCTQERESWQCRALWNMAPDSTSCCLVFSENPALRRGFLPSSEEGQSSWLRQE